MTMTETRKLADTVEELDRQIQLAYPFAERDYLIFGSAQLVMRDILDREPGDIDTFMTRKLWGRLLANEDWHVETPKAGDPPILVNDNTPITIHAFFDWANPYAHMDVAKELEMKEYIWWNHWVYPVMPVTEALRIKEAAAYLGGHEKHLPDIDVIKEWLKSSK